jgi:hypothetical protein
MKLFSLYKMGPNGPEYTGVTRMEKKNKKHTHNTQDRGGKSGHPTNLWGGWPMRTHRNPSTAITRKSPGIRKRGTTALVLAGVIERHWIAET